MSTVEWSLALEVVRCLRVQEYKQDRSRGIFRPIGRANERRNVCAWTIAICEMRYYQRTRKDGWAMLSTWSSICMENEPQELTPADFHLKL